MGCKLKVINRDTFNILGTLDLVLIQGVPFQKLINNVCWMYILTKSFKGISTIKTSMVRTRATFTRLSSKLVDLEGRYSYEE